MDACALVWNVSDEWFADYLRDRRTWSAQEVNAFEAARDAERGAYQPHGSAVHHSPDESRH